MKVYLIIDKCYTFITNNTTPYPLIGLGVMVALLFYTTTINRFFEK